MRHLQFSCFVCDVQEMRAAVYDWWVVPVSAGIANISAVQNAWAAAGSTRSSQKLPWCTCRLVVLEAEVLFTRASEV